jgi:hypothetical protein
MAAGRTRTVCHPGVFVTSVGKSLKTGKLIFLPETNVPKLMKTQGESFGSGTDDSQIGREIRKGVSDEFRHGMLLVIPNGSARAGHW